MLVDKDLQKAVAQLMEGNQIHLSFDGSDINLRVVDEASKLVISTSVFYGGNYIPMSVRKSIGEKLSNHSEIRTFLTVDEQHYQVNLHYLGHAHTLSHHHLKDLLEQFGSIAEKWRVYLNEHGKNDLIYVHKHK